MSVAIILTIGSVVSFIILASLFSAEKQSGHMFVASRLRLYLDNKLEKAVKKVKHFFVYIGKYIITLSWYYSLHTFLKLILQFLAGLYYMIEKILHSNRNKAKQIRKEKKKITQTHLDVLKTHQDENKLTESQKKRLKDKALSGK